MTKKELILANVKDLISSFLYYDRKEDEDLGVGDIQEAINNGEITKEEILQKFEDELNKGLLVK